jgi:acyl carrier protein
VTTVEHRLQEIARDVFGIDDLVLTDDTTAADVPGWDSLAHVNFMYCIEEAFGVRFSEDEFGELSDVAALRRSLEDKLGTARS